MQQFRICTHAYLSGFIRQSLLDFVHQFLSKQLYSRRTSTCYRVNCYSLVVYRFVRDICIYLCNVLGRIEGINFNFDLNIGHILHTVQYVKFSSVYFKPHWHFTE